MSLLTYANLCTPLANACDQNRPDVTSFLLKQLGVDPTLHSNWALTTAIAHKNVECVKLLLEDGRADPMAHDGFYLMASIVNGPHEELVHTLLDDPRVDPSVKDNKALAWAVRYGSESIVKRLLADPRVDPSACNNRCIKLAHIHNFDNIVKLLLADPRVQMALLDIIVPKKGSTEYEKLEGGVF